MLKKTAVLAALALSCAAAALEIRVENTTPETVVLAFNYLNSSSAKWTVEGWYNVRPRETALVSLETDNEIYYLYAEFSNGKRLEGDQDALELKVAERSFVYEQDRAAGFEGRTVRFLKARGLGKKAQIRIN